MSDEQNLAWIVSTLRKLHGITLQELASQNGVERPNMSAWFGGRRPKVLSKAKQHRLAEFLGWRFDQLIASHVHMWKVATTEDLALLAEFLRRTINPENQRLVITRCGIGNSLVGLLLFIATKDGEGVLIRVRRASEIQVSAQGLIQALGFGEVTSSWRIENHEYEACWRDESLAIQVADYLPHLPDDGKTASALDYASSAWRDGADGNEDANEYYYSHPENEYLKSLMPELSTPDDRAGLHDEAQYPPTSKEDWLNSRSHELWMEFAWKCASEGFSVQDALRWKEQALKNVRK